MSSEASTHYQQKVAFCGKKRCKKCRDGIGHGPYWYASEKTENGTIRTYLGAQQQAMEHVLKLVDLSLMQEDLPRTIQLLDQLSLDAIRNRNASRLSFMLETHICHNAFSSPVMQVWGKRGWQKNWHARPLNRDGACSGDILTCRRVASRTHSGRRYFVNCSPLIP